MGLWNPMSRKGGETRGTPRDLGHPDLGTAGRSDGFSL